MARYSTRPYATVRATAKTIDFIAGLSLILLSIAFAMGTYEAMLHVAPIYHATVAGFALVIFMGAIAFAGMARYVAHAINGSN